MPKNKVEKTAMKVEYEKMTTKEFLESVKKMPVFIVPTGLLEWHGDHLPQSAAQLLPREPHMGVEGRPKRNSIAGAWRKSCKCDS